METYEEFINNILETRGRFNCGDEYHERHHIVPKCLDGTNDESNLIDLYAKEHFEAHRLLALENPDNNGLVYAWWMMSHVKDKKQYRYEVSAEEYEEARIAASILISKTRSGENHPQYGTHPTEETRAKQSKAQKERCTDIEERQRRSQVAKKIFGDPEFRQNQSERMKSREISKETRFRQSVSQKERWGNIEERKRQSACMSGENNPMFGKHQPEETRKKIRETKKLIQCVQYDLNGKFIRLWDCAQDVERELGIFATQILCCCKHRPHYKSAGGFLWFYADDITQPDKSHILIIQNDLELVI